MLVKLDIDCEREAARIVTFIREQLADADRSRVVLGLSGGIDSAVCAALGAKAAGRENVRALILPYCTSNPESEAHALLVAQQLGIPCERWDITSMVRPLLDQYPDMDERRKGNIMARVRMIVLFDQSALHDGLVVGTSNRTETLLGYFTMHGDAAAAMKPIAHLYKCQVRALARHCGLPEVIIAKPPSADLWTGQTDEGELGFTYDQADQVLYLLVDEGLTIDQIAARGFERSIVEAIEGRMRSTAFKRRPTPELEPQRRIHYIRR